MSSPTSSTVTRPEAPELALESAHLALVSLDSSPNSLRREITLSLRFKIRSLRTFAMWPFRRISLAVQLPVSTVFSICAQPNTPPEHRTGRPHRLSHLDETSLIAHAIASQENRRKPLPIIAEELGIKANERTLRCFFASKNYHRQLARAKPFLSVKNKTARLLFANTYRDWSVHDWAKVIWTDECAFNVGGFSGNTWVTRTPAEEFAEDCLVPKFRKLQTIMVWGCITGNQKGPLVIWNKAEWGKTVKGPSYCEYIVVPHLHPFWLQLCQEREDYVYLQQDNASPHKAKYTTTVIKNLNIFGYFFTWPPTSPDLNPIEQVRRIMRDRIHKRSPRPTSNEVLLQAIQEEWDAITSEEIASMTSSLLLRVLAVKEVSGGHTKY